MSMFIMCRQPLEQVLEICDSLEEAESLLAKYDDKNGFEGCWIEIEEVKSLRRYCYNDEETQKFELAQTINF